MTIPTSILHKSILHLVILLFFTTPILTAQETQRVKILVVDKTLGTPLPGATLKLIKSGRSLVVNEKGITELFLGSGERLDLEVSSVGYAALIK